MSNAHPFRFGVITESTASREQWVKLVRKAEDLGYATFLLADHYVNEFPPLTGLMAAAAATTTLRVGSFVFDNDFRHPAMLAKEVAALDLLSDGRFELGIGAGWHQPEYEQVGLPFDRAGVRIDRLEEALQIIKQFFQEERVNFTGEHYTVRDLQAFPKSVQRPHPPILMGGGGKRLLSLAGREADIIGIHVKISDQGGVDAWERTEEALTEKVEWVRQAAGERFDRIELNMLIHSVQIGQNRQQAAEEYLRANQPRGATVESLLGNPYRLFGNEEEIIEHIQQLRTRFGISYLVLDTEYMDLLAPVVARLAGS